jgi:transcriptional repressor NrdR
VECPYCGADSRVSDSRPAADGVRRRRECLECERRFTTYERLAPPEIRVEKRGGASEDFDRDKLLAVVERVTRGRAIAEKARRDLVRGLEAQLVDEGAKTVPSWLLAERLLLRLRELDALAATRFASNYTQEDGTIRIAHDEPSPQLELPAVAPPTVPPAEPPRRRKKG